jgi:hypothetical protein
MVSAVANRAPEPFATQAEAPDWQLNPDQEMWLAPPANDQQPLVDEDGNPTQDQVPPDDAAPPPDDRPPVDEQEKPQPDRLDRAWLDRTLRTRPPAEPPRVDAGD